MAPAATLIPALISAGGAIGGSLLGRKSVQGATQRSPEELAALQGQTGAANALTQQSGQLSAFGMPLLKQAGGYFSKLAGGNRGVMTQALSPEISSINDVYGGTARTLSRFLRGPEKDVQLAESERERAGQIGRLFGGARIGANTALGGMGEGATGAAASGFGGAGGIFGGQAALGQANRFGGAELERSVGSDFGGLIFNLLKNWGQKGGSSTGVLPSRQTVPTSTSWMPGG